MYMSVIQIYPSNEWKRDLKQIINDLQILNTNVLSILAEYCTPVELNVLSRSTFINNKLRLVNDVYPELYTLKFEIFVDNELKKYNDSTFKTRRSCERYINIEDVNSITIKLYKNIKACYLGNIVIPHNARITFQLRSFEDFIKL